MEDLIPLIIIILISLVGAIGRKKKKSMQGTVSDAPQRKDEIFSWLEQLANSDEIKTPERVQPEVVDQPQANKTPEKNKYSQYSGFISPEEKVGMMAKEGMRINDRPKYVKHVSEIEGGKHETKDKHSIKKHSIVEHFNLKQAVVFSELLNRKYQ